MPKLLYSAKDHPEQTYDDVFMVPNNPIVARLFDCAEQIEIDTLVHLHRAARESRKISRQFMKDNHQRADAGLQNTALQAHRIFRSYVLELANKYPNIKENMSRDDVDFHPVDGFGNTPIVVANMNNVTGKRMAEGAAMMGGSAAVPQDKSNEEMREIADYLHSRNINYMTPIIVGPDTKVHDLQTYLQKRDIDTAIVTDNGQSDGLFVGIVKLQKKDEEMSIGLVPHRVNQDSSIRTYIRTTDIVKVEGDIDYEQAARQMEVTRTHFLPILTTDGHVKGALTKMGAALQWRYKPHADTEAGGLAMLGTVGALNKSPADRVKALLDLPVKGIVFDTAHFDQGIETYTNVEAAATIIANSRRKVFMAAGNVVTASAVRDIFAAGADVAKVGIGPGAMCSTRMETGVGRPQFTAVLKTAQAAKEMGKNVWADGGILYPRDVALALAAGASQVMIGSLFASTYETPPDFEHDGEKLYKENYGMASRHAATLRFLHSLERDMRSIFRSTTGHRSEGISDSKVYQREGKESVSDMIHWIMDGVTSAMTYMGARNLEEFSRFAKIGLQGGTGYAEGKPKSSL